jgi:quercetin dioxygenase-like cupin family protein
MTEHSAVRALPRVVADARTLLADTATAQAGILWRLQETGRQLDANLVHLPSGEGVGLHAEGELDVLLVVAGGTGSMDTEDGVLPLSAGVMIWLPRGARRSLAAGDGGLSYLTVHTRRPGMQIQSTPPRVLEPPPPTW